MTRIAVIVGSTRPGRRAEMVAHWVKESAATRTDAVVELVDLADFDLPLLDEPVPALFGDYRHEHTLRWAKTIASYDGFVFVTPEYNHSYPAAVKNAIDYLFAEWNDKAAGFVSYGTSGGIRAVEHLRLTLAEVRVAGVRSQVSLSLFNDFVITDPTQPGIFSPAEHQEASLATMLDEVITWAGALKPLREAVAA
ncbi:NAD(P)H-dependent FMN reductase [Actinokineospora alba]|uniref:NAD(P)H-dependent FMN reductase n=1 Tax=Actinokineospora alba TaxID=504798 RepID=A0A1H0W374_9PSEU|nr:NAD(P)H-dependent oxidoreductase [Actinokineospora alba]TDP67811.1 NAD(P)H-dependent FMN reductase [Actinokineospora alba]SDI72271.1 NAD(P)H-dependent FMN reductase [Actinokineospora alba]SDP85003.1 NAD(P)H-dependent FMN reductase [Actinokineospora alba]